LGRFAAALPNHAETENLTASCRRAGARCAGLRGL